jgi:trehalose 6-phosphate phosphatase
MLLHWRDAINTSLKRLLAKPRLGIVTDVDGTISPIVAHADMAQVTPRNKELLRDLVELLPLVAVISGRSSTDVRERVSVPGIVYIGNHGLERWVEGRIEVLPEVSASRPAIEAAIEAAAKIQVPGLWVEDKGATISVHYRQTENPTAIRASYQSVVRAIAVENGLNFSEGQMVFELRPPLNYDKGSAFRELVSKHELDGALYLGDDITDLAALKAARDLKQDGVCFALGVGVVTEGGPEAVRENADLYAQGVPDVEALFSWLLNARSASSACA